MAKKKSAKGGKDVALAAMREKLADLGYEDVVEDLELLAIDPEDRRTCPLVGMSVISTRFCIVTI